MLGAGSLRIVSGSIFIAFQGHLVLVEDLLYTRLCDKGQLLRGKIINMCCRTKHCTTT